jgi:hypothetical protein
MTFLNRITPFLLAGIMIAVLAFGLVILAYLFLIGTLIGSALFAMSWVRARFTAPKPIIQKKPSGRVIDTDEWRKL